ncbi:MAG: alpha/beta fold hydrolase [Bacteroidota bacterium]
MFNRTLAALVAVCLSTGSLQAQESPLSVEKIMQAPETWIGAWPSDHYWSEDGSALYFSWNPRGEFASDSLFRVDRAGGDPVKVPPAERLKATPRFTGWEHGRHRYDADFSRKVFVEEGDVYLFDRVDRTTRRLTKTLEQESDARFTPDGRSVVFVRSNNLYVRHLESGLEEQLTDLRRGSEPSEPDRTDQEEYLRSEEQDLIGYIRQQRERREAREKAQLRDDALRDLPPTYYYGDRTLTRLQLDPTGRFVSFVAVEGEPNATSVHAYVTESAYAENISARPKVGSASSSYELVLQDLERDTTYAVELHQLPGSYDIPEFRRERGEAVDSATTKRNLVPMGPYWSGDGAFAVIEVRAEDNKTRWIARLDAASGELMVVDRQHDEAWIAGPGLFPYPGGESTIGWLPDNRRIYFQSEASGFSHLYIADVETGTTRQLTSGDFEVFDPMLSRDGKTWFFSSSEVSPFERHFYRMPVEGGERTLLTAIGGMNEFALDPREEVLGILHSQTTHPPEIYLQTIFPRGRTADARRITHSPTEEWLSYDWRRGEIIHIEASDGVDVPAQIFVPERPNGSAVLFVHGAGYLQNVHRGWSQYFREYMFHNLLADLGYTVLNVDYRASEGYGRDWRTAIYRHMGGRDLQDYVDASRYVGENYGIPPERVFIYGGSYGGFITMMALFTEPKHFGGGAALRSVTDWAHYNHPYTSNILNTPVEDTLAYRRSSPIYFADGLEDPLVILHGIVDVNVQFQDVVRLSQRLIELGKEDWEMAVYPVEDHGFTEPESWTDEYRRILKYIRLSVGPAEAALEEIPVLRNEQRAGADAR